MRFSSCAFIIMATVFSGCGQQEPPSTSEVTESAALEFEPPPERSEEDFIGAAWHEHVDNRLRNAPDDEAKREQLLRLISVADTHIETLKRTLSTLLQTTPPEGAKVDSERHKKNLRTNLKAQRDAKKELERKLKDLGA